MAQTISELEIRAMSLAWLTITELVYKSPFIPCSNLRPSKKQIEFLALGTEECLYGGAVGGGKALGEDSYIHTTYGLKTMGSLQVGDHVLGTNRLPVKVVAVSEVMRNRPCYRLTFSDGQRIVADADHKWDAIGTKAGLQTTLDLHVDYLCGKTPLIFGGPSVKHSERIDSVPVKCIQVDAKDGMFLVGETGIPTHNSDALLMAALMYVSIPNYSAILFRRTYGQLTGDGGLVPRSKEWFGDKAIFREKNMQWTFPSGATLSFGYFDHDDDRNKYIGNAWQFCGWDEATAFKFSWYEFMFSRLRKPSWMCKHCQHPLTRDDFTVQNFRHKKPELSPNCPTPEPMPMPVNHLGMSLADVPIRVRAASNPGGISHTQFKRRFVVPGAPKIFVKSLLDDNPGLDHDDYKRKLDKLDPITKAQYLNGDWDAYHGGRIRKNWFREFYVDEGKNGQPVYKWDNEDVDGIVHSGWPVCPIDGIPCDRFFNMITVDPASTEGDQYDYTAIGVFAVSPSNEIFILEVIREQMNLEEIVPRIGKLAIDYNAMFVGIEDVAFQRGIIREGQRTLNVPVERLPTEGKSKLVRATPAIIRASEGQYFIPKNEPAGKFGWIDDFIAELVVFTGAEDSYDDQVDIFAYSALSLLRHGLLTPTAIQPDDDGEQDDYDRGGSGIFMSSGIEDRFDVM